MLAIILILNLFVVFVNSNNEKRLVLHSEFDIAQEFANVNNKIVNLTKVIAEKEKELISVNAKLNELTAAKDKEIEALKKAFEENKGTTIDSLYY
jgi:predicted  nucleic acid-binding Zn-ribbon protein